MRENMAAVRRHYEDGGWADWGETYAYVNATQFQVQNIYATSRYRVDRRVRAVGATTGTIYGVITASAFNSPHTDVSVQWDAGQLENEALAISLGVDDRALSGVNPSDLGTAAFQDVGTATGNVPQLEDVSGSPGLPAVDGSQLTNVGQGLELLSVTTSGATREFTDPAWFGGAYAGLVLEFDSVIPATNGANLWMRVSTDGGSTWLAGTSYLDGNLGVAGDGSTYSNFAQNDRWGLAGEIPNGATLGGCSGSATITGLATRCKLVGNFVFARDGAFSPISGNNVYGAMAPLGLTINGLQVLMSSGNIASGAVRLYGLRA